MSKLPDTLEKIATAALVPYARNSRTHSPAQVAQVANSILEFGFTNPVLIDADNGIIAGHGRVMAAQSLGLAEVPCIRLGYLTDAQKRAYIIADNQVALNSGWDEDMLRAELMDLRDVDFDLDLIGFDAEFLEDMLEEDQPENPNDADHVPNVPVTPVTKAGDVWVLGKHRIMCGDSTDAESVALLMNGCAADLCFTSPPYGQQRDYIDAKEHCSDWDNLMRGVFTSIPMKQDGQVLVNLGLIHRDGEWVPYWDRWIEWMREQGWRRFGWYVWDQGPGMPGDGNGRLAPSHEFIWHFNRKSVGAKKSRECKHAGEPSGGGQRGRDGVVKQRSSGSAPVQSHAIQDSVFRVNRQGAIHGADGHPAPYPVGLPLLAMQSWPGLVYEPFSGSGTTIIAAEKTGQRCYAMELTPNYVDIAIKRWQEFTGKQAVLEATGQTFDELANG